MKRLKVFSALLVCVLSVSALCTGIYSASRISANIIGTLSIIPVQKKLENAISIENSAQLNVSVSCSVENGTAQYVPADPIVKSGDWTAGSLYFSNDTYNSGQLKLKSVKMKMLVKNNDSVPVCATIDAGGGNLSQEAVEITTLGNSYIAPGATQEISVQFSAIYDRSSVVSTPSINTYHYNVNIAKAQELSVTYVYDLIKYDNDTSEYSMPTKGFNYYIEFGDNPYYNNAEAESQGDDYPHRAKLRWYVWAKDNGSGTPVAITDSDKIVDSVTSENKLSKGNIYYFISEYGLNSHGNSGICFNSEYYKMGTGSTANYYNDYNDYSFDYAGSTIRRYLNGETIKAGMKYDSTTSCYMQNGVNVNFLNYYNLTSDVIYSLITGRRLESLYGDMNSFIGADTSIPLPENNNSISESDTDVFWLLSFNETFGCILEENAMTQDLSYGCNIGYFGWWMRSPSSVSYRTTSVPIVDMYGYEALGHIELNIEEGATLGVRPAFMLAI